MGQAETGNEYVRFNRLAPLKTLLNPLEYDCRVLEEPGEEARGNRG